VLGIFVPQVIVATVPSTPVSGGTVSANFAECEFALAAPGRPQLRNVISKTANNPHQFNRRATLTPFFARI
jgi:hypothetical protein